ACPCLTQPVSCHTIATSRLLLAGEAMGFPDGSSGPWNSLTRRAPQLARRRRDLRLPPSECGRQRERLLGPVHDSRQSRNGGLAKSWAQRKRRLPQPFTP